MNAFYLIAYVPMFVLRALALLASIVMSNLPRSKLFTTINTNLRLAYPEMDEHERLALVRRVIRHQCLTAVESAKCWAMPPEWSVEQIYSVHNQELLIQALNNSKGMLAIVPHLGTWEMMNAWLNQFGAPTIMYKPVKGAQANEFVLAGRQRLNATLVPTDSTGVKAIFKTLKEGGFSIILPDHVPDLSGGVVVPFFGVPTLSSTLTPKLANKTGCALIGLTCVRRDDGQGFDIYCDNLDNPKLYDKDMTVATTALNDEIVQMVNRFPHQYMWGYRRFKHVPNVDNIYALSGEELAQIPRQGASDVKHH